MIKQILLHGYVVNKMITLNNINLQIKNLLLLKNENIDLFEGYIHVIIGKSGSGKTTLLHEISLISHYSKALYKWNDQIINNLNDYERAEIRRTKIGYVLQDLELISENLSLEDNIKCMAALAGQEYNEIKVFEYMNKLGLPFSLKKKTIELSKGERQRFAVLLALIKNADLIICDEPTSALDIKNSLKLMECLSTIAKDYQKMIVIATHDKLIIDKADIVYKIQNKELISNKNIKATGWKKNSNKSNHIKNQFYKIYRKSQSKKWIIIKSVNLIMMMVLCLGPLILDFLLAKQEKLYQAYADNEIIVINTKDKPLYSKYNGENSPFDHEQIDLLKELEFVKEVHYYWEMSGVLQDMEVTVIPKHDIDEIILSPKLYLNIFFNLKEYHFTKEITNYETREYMSTKNSQTEIVYIPIDMMEKMLKENGINTSSSISVSCDKIENLEKTSVEIKKWLTNVTVEADGLEYVDELKRLDMLKNFIVVLKAILITGIIILSYIIQTIKNNARTMEINNLRINGLEKRSFCYLYCYENYRFILLIIFSCVLGYTAMATFSLSFSISQFLIILIKSFIYTFFIEIISLFSSIHHIFKKDISEILKDN